MQHLSFKHNKRAARAPRVIQTYKATHTCTTCPPSIHVARTCTCSPSKQVTRAFTKCHTSTPSESHVQHVTASLRSVSHVSRSSPNDPHVQPLTVRSPSDMHVQHVTTSAPWHCTCTTCPTSTRNPHDHHLLYKHTKQPARTSRVLQSYK